MYPKGVINKQMQQTMHTKEKLNVKRKRIYYLSFEDAKASMRFTINFFKIKSKIPFKLKILTPFSQYFVGNHCYRRISLNNVAFNPFSVCPLFFMFYLSRTHTHTHTHTHTLRQSDFLSFFLSFFLSSLIIIFN